MTREPRGLIEKARRSLAAAELLLANGEPSFASARAYYTMFYVAEALLLGEGLAFTKHSAVIAAFGERFAKTGRVPAAFHRYLIRGFEIRQEADYELSEVPSEDAAEHLARAREFLQLADKMAPGGPA